MIFRNQKSVILVGIVLCCLGIVVWSKAAVVTMNTTTLEGKVMAGYQGWFATAGDGGLNQWQHWSQRGKVPSNTTVRVDMWPDLRELGADELYPTAFQYKNGTNASLFSSYNAKTVERHCRWMKDYGVDGVFVQRFVGSATKSPRVVDQVLANVRNGSQKYSRVFAVMYDISSGNESTIVTDIIDDWKHLVDNQTITQSSQYLRHRGKPLLAIWGFGFTSRIGTAAQAATLIDWFKNKADTKYKATLMGGVPTGWRNLTRDSKNDTAWASVYRSFDVISPWTVGRMIDVPTADVFREKYITPDMKECKALGKDFLPVVFPGYSFQNAQPGNTFNSIPRKGGTFYWRQMYNAIDAGSKMVYVAMFDEVDEATAIFKVAENSLQVPATGQFLTLDADAGYSKVPSDWYLRLTGNAARLLRQGKKLPATMPSSP